MLLAVFCVLQLVMKILCVWESRHSLSCSANFSLWTWFLLWIGAPLCIFIECGEPNNRFYGILNHGGGAVMLLQFHACAGILRRWNRGSLTCWQLWQSCWKRGTWMVVRRKYVKLKRKLKFLIYDLNIFKVF